MKQKKDQKGSFGWALLGWFVPLAGIILYFVWKNERPGDAKMALWGALASIIVIFILAFVVAITGAIAIPGIINETNAASECISNGGTWMNGACQY